MVCRGLAPRELISDRLTIFIAVNVTGSIHHLAGGLYLFGLFGVLANACVLFLLVFLGALERAQMP